MQIYTLFIIYNMSKKGFILREVCKWAELFKNSISKNDYQECLFIACALHVVI